MKLHIDTDDEMGGDSSAVAEALVNLKEDIPPDFSQPSSPPKNSTGLGRPKIISPHKFLKLQTKNAQLKEELHEYEVLDRFIKIENTTLKGRLAPYQVKELDMCAQVDKFCSQANLLSHENRKLHSRLNRRYQEARILLIENGSLRKKLRRTGQEVEDEAEDNPDDTQS